MHNTQSRLPVNDNDVVTSIATIGTFEAVVFFFSDFIQTWIFSTKFRKILKYRISRKSV